MSATAVRPPSHLPKTFLEWGVAVPFTTPLLSGGRVRPGRRGRPEMLMPNPSGGRGLYVFDLAAAPEVTSLTLHDRLLLERLLELPAPSPSEIRKAAHEVAIEGAAGRKAAREASAAADTDATTGLLTRFHLVTNLLEEAGLEKIDWRSFSGDDRELRAMIRGHLAKVAPKLGVPVDGLFEQIEAIGEIATPVGPPIEGRVARNEAMLARLQTLILSLRQWSAGETGATAADAAAVLAVAERTSTEASEAQQRARDLLGGVMGPAARVAPAGRRAAAHHLHAAGMAAGRLGAGLRAVGIRGARRAVGPARDAAADQGVLADAGPRRPRRRDGFGRRGHPLRPRPARAAARGLAHGAHRPGRPGARRAAAGRDHVTGTAPPLGLDRDMSQASDEQLLRVVGLIDTLDRRGPVDRVLEPVRARLALLRPPRPVTWAAC